MPRKGSKREALRPKGSARRVRARWRSHAPKEQTNDRRPQNAVRKMGAGVTAYYNEHDPFAAEWLRDLIKDGLIAPGEVDERSIEDVRPSDLAGFVQCHFFAGIGIWSLALRQAGWSDDEPIWTGSCPCQPFSAAGKGGGFADERHLWPAFHWLIDQCGPELVVGEQVASKDGLAWLDLVSADVEASGYAFGAVDTCAAGFGAPHIRQRLYWMADASGESQSRRRVQRSSESCGESSRTACERLEGLRAACRLADADDARLEGRFAQRECVGKRATRPGGVGGGLDDAASARHQRSIETTKGQARNEARLRLSCETSGLGGVGIADSGHAGRHAGTGSCAEGRAQLWPIGDALSAPSPDDRPGPLNGLWRAADWLCCTDGKWRPVAPGTFPLAPGGTVRNRVGQLRGAGNAINLAQAVGFIEAVMEHRANLPTKLAA